MQSLIISFIYEIKLTLCQHVDWYVARINNITVLE